MSEVRAAFVMEQTLGHITHHRNLEMVAARQSRVRPTWVPVAFPTHGLERIVPGFATNWSVRASYRARRELDRILRSRPHQALFFHTQVTSLFSVGLMRRIPTVVSLDATPINYDTVGRAYGHRPAAGGRFDETKYRLNRTAFHAARALVTWSEWTRNSLIADYGVEAGKISVLAPGAAPAYFEIGCERTPHRPGDPIRILFVGGDFERKGGPLLLRAIRGLRTKEPFELHLVTNADVAPEPGVHVHRNVAPNSPQLLRLFRSADIFALPSFAECLSIALMEAAAAALPIVSTDVGALREVARDGDNALVIAAGDGEALRCALARLIDDDPLRRRLGAASLVLAQAKFSAESNDRAVLELIAAVALARDERIVA
jgi:glycosyltransferase involved in cell wall biosynthesis